MASINDSPAQNGQYNEQETLELLRRFLPSQPPLKDFIHHNPLHGFQRLKFEDGLAYASKIFGYQVYLPLEEYRSLYGSGRISRTALEQAMLKNILIKVLKAGKTGFLPNNIKPIGTLVSGHYAPTGRDYIKLTLIRKHIQCCFVSYPVIWTKESLSGSFR